MSRYVGGRVIATRALIFSFAAGFNTISALAEDTDRPKIEEIVVTASPYAVNASNLATIVGQVSRDQILRHGGASLADALVDVPGVTGTGFAAGASRPVIRGFDANRVKITENGIGSFDVSDVGPDHGIPIDPLSTQKIEVVRGAATLRFGSQAIGGVVNAINNRVPLSLPEKTASGEASASFGSGSNLRQGSVLMDARAGQFAFHADGFARHTGDYDIPGGKQANSFFRGEGIALGGGYIGKQARGGTAVVHYGSRYGIPGETNFIDMQQTKGLFRASIAANGVIESINIDAGYADYEHSEKDAAGVPQATFIDKEWDSRIEALIAPNDTFSAAAFGAQAQHRDFSALGEGADYLLPTTTKTIAAFGFAETPISQSAVLQIGARVERVDVDGTPLINSFTQRQFTPVSGSMGVVVTPTADLTLGLTLSSAARAPGQTELFARGPHEGSQTFELGAPELREERSNSLEATIRFDSVRVTFEAAAWTAHFDNYIYGRLTGRTCDDEGVCADNDMEELKELIFEQRDARFRGLEGKATLTLAKLPQGALTLGIMADFVRATFSSGGNVPRLPPYHIGAGLGWTNETLDTGVFWKFSGAQNKVANGDTTTDGFSSLDAHVSWRPSANNPGLAIGLVGRNLTNTAQRNAVSLNKDEITLPGRDVRLVVRSTF